MASTNDPFGQARLKLIWANQRITEAHSYWERFLETDFYKLVVETDEGDGGDILKVSLAKDIPADLVLCIGDAIHNLKSALDYTISELDFSAFASGVGALGSYSMAE